MAALENPAPTHVLRAVFGATFFIRFGFGLTLAVFASYLTGTAHGSPEQLAAAVGAVGLVSAMAPIGEFSTVLFSGTAADRYGRLRVLTIGMIVAAAMMLLTSLTRSIGPLILFQLGFGVASGAILASSLGEVADHSGAGERGFEMGRFDAVNLMGWILGFAVGLGALGALAPATVGELATILRFGSLAVAAGVVFVILSTRKVVEKGAPGAFHFRRIREAALRRDVWLVTVPWLAIYMLLGTLLVFLGTASTGEGLSPTLLAVVIGGAGLVLLLTQPFFGRLADRYGRQRLLLVGTIGFLGILGAAALVTAYGPRLGLLALIGVFVLPALAYGPAALAALADLSRSISRSTTMAIYTLTISLGMIIGILLASQLFALLGALGLYLYYAFIATILLVFLVLRYRSPVAAPDP